VQLARAAGEQVHVGRRTPDPLRYQGLVVLTPEHALSADDVLGAAGQTTLIVLPKWFTAPDPAHRGWVVQVSIADPEIVSNIVANIAPGSKITQAAGNSRVVVQGRDIGVVEQLQSISGPELTPVLSDRDGRAILVRLDSEAFGVFYILTDPDFLNTHGLRDRERAGLALNMLQALNEPGWPIVFDVTLNGLGTDRSILRLAFEPPFLGATLALAFAGALLGWRAFARDGPSAPPRRAIALGKAALADNSAALLRLTGRDRRLGAGYVRLVVMHLAEQLSGVRKEEAEAIAWLDQIAAAHNLNGRFGELAREAAAPQTPLQMLETARKLHALRQEIERATR
jgi:hypothetical protein